MCSEPSLIVLRPRQKALGDHASEHRTYQPLIEPKQLARLPRLLKRPEYARLTSLAQRRWEGQEPDWAKGATHFLAPEKTMVALHRQNPDKYHNWGPLKNSRGVPGQNWTGYNPETGSYRGVRFRDGSHAFLIPGTDSEVSPTEMSKVVEPAPDGSLQQVTVDEDGAEIRTPLDTTQMPTRSNLPPGDVTDQSFWEGILNMPGVDLSGLFSGGASAPAPRINPPSAPLKRGGVRFDPNALKVKSTFGR